MAAEARRFGGTRAVLDLATIRLEDVRPGAVKVRVSAVRQTDEAQVRIERAAAVAGTRGSRT
jgi:hypothetical protein